MLGRFPMSEVPLSGTIPAAPVVPTLPPGATIGQGKFRRLFPPMPLQGITLDLSTVEVPPSKMVGRFANTIFAKNLSFQKTPQDTNAPFSAMSVTQVVGTFIIRPLRRDASYNQSPEDINAPAPPIVLPPVPIDSPLRRPDNVFNVTDLRPDGGNDNASLRPDGTDILPRRPDECGPH